MQLGGDKKRCQTHARQSQGKSFIVSGSGRLYIQVRRRGGKRSHAHALLLFNGQKVCKDAHLGDQIGNYWNEKITGGSGVFHNCSRDKDRYEQCGIGMIDHSDFAKRAILEEKVIGYMLKDEQRIDGIKQSGREKSVTKGVCTRKRSNAGRPRN